MRKILLLGAISLSCLTVPTSAGAETRLLRVPFRLMAFMPLEAGSKHLIVGETLWKVPLRWVQGAIIQSNAQLAADERRESLVVGQVLAETKLAFDDGSFANAASWCVPRIANPNKKTFGMVGGILARSLTDGQFCIIDRDRNGTAEFSVLVNAGSPEARTPKPIAPISYRTEEGAEAGPGDYASLTYRGGRSFELEIFQQGGKRRFSTYTANTNFGRETYQPYLRRTKAVDGSTVLISPSGQLTLKPQTGSKQEIDVSWAAMPRLKIVPVPDEVVTTYGYY